jgi:hypothetical protein
VRRAAPALVAIFLFYGIARILASRGFLHEDAYHYMIKTLWGWPH